MDDQSIGISATVKACMALIHQRHPEVKTFNEAASLILTVGESMIAFTAAQFPLQTRDETVKRCVEGINRILAVIEGDQRK